MVQVNGLEMSTVCRGEPRLHPQRKLLLKLLVLLGALCLLFTLRVHHRKEIYNNLKTEEVNATHSRNLPYQRVSAARVKHLHETNKLKGHFAQFGKDSYAYSAYFDPRNKTNPVVRIIAIMNLEDMQDPFFCHVLDEKNKTHIGLSQYQNLDIDVGNSRKYRSSIGFSIKVVKSIISQ